MKHDIYTITMQVFPDDNYRMIAFGDSVDEIANYIIVQKACSFADQEIDAGMDRYYFEYNCESGYGICDEVRFDGNVISFFISQNAPVSEKEIILTLKGEYDSRELEEYMRYMFD